ncbi:MAG: translocation/assembly module TamB domain-containing protein [Aquificaceae bacterium]
MRLVGYLILLLLAFYFIFLKPYLLAKRVYWELEGISFSFERGLTFKSLLLYLPHKDLTLHLFMKDVSLKPWHFYVKELSLIEVSKAISDKPFDYDFTSLTRLASRLNLRVDSLYISTNSVPYGESLTLFIPQTEIRAGQVFSKGWTKAYWMHFQDVHSLEVYLEKAHLKGAKFIVDKAHVKSPLYSFELRGFWEGKRGAFTAWGRIEPVEGENYSVGGIRLDLKGDVEYTRLRVAFSGKVEKLLIKNRREYEGLGIEGQYLWVRKKENTLKGRLWKANTWLSFDYSLRDKIFEGSFGALELDGRLLGIKRDVSSVVGGSIRVNLDKKYLSLQAHTPLLRVDQHTLNNCTLKLDLDYSPTSKGSFDFLALQPFYLSLRGSFSKDGVLGEIALLDYPLKMESLSSKLSYKGSLYIGKDGKLFTEGDGRLLGLTYKDIGFGSASYHLKVDGDSYSIDLRGDTFSLQGGGSLEEKSFSGRLSFTDMNLSYGDLSVRSLGGHVDIRSDKSSTNIWGTLKAFLSKGNRLSSHVLLDLDITKKGEEVLGAFKGSLKEVRAFDLVYEKGEFGGQLRGEKVSFSFDIDQRIRGGGQYGLKDGSYSLTGSIKDVMMGLSLNGSYEIRGVNKDLDMSFAGEGGYRGFSFPIKGGLSLRGDVIRASLNGFSIKEGLISIKAGGIELNGSGAGGVLEIKPVSLFVGQELLSRLDFEKGAYRGSAFNINGKVAGVVEGDIRVSYHNALSLFSEGNIDLKKLFSLVRSRVLADGEGKVSYNFSYQDGKLSLSAVSDRSFFRSRYVAVPLEGSLRLNTKENKLFGSLSLIGNQRAHVFANFAGDGRLMKVDFELSNLPILFREQTMRASLLLSGKGGLISDYKSLSIGGKFYTSGFVNLQRLTSKGQSPPEWYQRIRLDISVASSEPLRVNLPEGFIYTDLLAVLKGSLYEPEYRINAYFKGGDLSYFGKNFYVRRGSLTLTNKESHIDLTVLTPTPSYSIILDIKGNPQYPKVLVRSEPPRDIREVLTALVLGGKEGEGLIPVADALVSQVPQLSQLVKGAQSITGLDIRLQVSPALSPTGEVGINATISKDITEKISIEHRQSTLKNPKETYTGGEVRLTPNTSVGGRIYSDRSQEYRIRMRRKFDF